MIITWEVDDGYAGGSRPHTTDIPDDEFDEDMTEEQKEQIIIEYVEQSFRDSVSWSITGREA